MFLSQLLRRTLGGETGIRPRRAARFEPVAPPAAEEPVPSPLPAPRAPAGLRPADRDPARPRVTQTIEQPARDRGTPAPETSVAQMLIVHTTDARPPAEAPEQKSVPISQPEGRPAAAAPSKLVPADPAPSRPPLRRAEAVQAAPAPKPARQSPAAVELVSRRVEKRTVEERLTRLAGRARADAALPAAPASRPRVGAALPVAPAPRVPPPPSASASVAQRRPRQGPSPAPAAAPEPVIEIRIGRVELRASAAAPPARTARPAAPVSSLEEYLRARDRS